MAGLKDSWWLGLVLAVALAAGCAGLFSGNLLEKQHQNGQVDRLRVDGGEGWNWGTYDKNPTKPDEAAIMLKTEKTF
jgi:hypothetical protein